nr:reverse transcriptase domain-containing protein [Tanacetum cinerariifolium]
MIIEVEIGGHCIHRMYVDGGSASEILYKHYFSRLRLKIKNQLIPATTPLIRFSGEIICSIRKIQLLVKIRDEEHSTLAWMNFVVVRSPSPYNGIIGRPGVRKLQAVSSTAHAMLKLPMEGGVITLKSSRMVLLECAMVSRPEGNLPATKMCVDFKDLNKACPKDGYPLPEIDWKVESLCGFPFKCFFDAYKGFTKYKWQKKIKKNSVHYKPRNILLYKDAFRPEKCRSNLPTSGGQSIPQTDWQKSRSCTFGVEEGLFLGYKVNTRGLKVCPDKVDIVLSLPSLKCLNDVQKLNGKLASLNMFLAKSAEKSLPFFKTLKKCVKKSDFHWTAEAEEAFKQMKQLIAKLPMLAMPMEKKELIFYLAAAKETVSVVLMTKKETKKMPIYFVSRALRGPQINYTSMEKLVLALVHASKRLKRYFQAHPIIVITDLPIQQVLLRPEVAGRLQKWSIKLGEYTIHYRRRVLVKGQILADFIVERPEEDSPDSLMEVEEEFPKP